MRRTRPPEQSSPGVKSIVFDFDFTLADSTPGVVESANHAFRRLGMPLRSVDAIRRTIGLSLRDALIELQGEQAADAAERFISLFIERADAVMVDHTQLYEVVPEVLGWLRDRGYRIGIVSTKFRRRIEAVLRRHGLDGAVDLVIGGEDTKVHKPDPAGLLLARRGLLGDAHPAIYVGDHPVDGRAASAAGFEFIAVLTGVHEARSFSGFAPLAILETLAELPRALGGP